MTRSASLAIDGHLLVSSFDFTSVKKIFGLFNMRFDISAVTRVYGLGISQVDIREHSIGMDMRLWVLATPVDGTLIDLSILSQIRDIRGPKRFIAGIGFLPLGLRAPIMNKFVVSHQIKDIKKDVVIWGRKKYRSRPRLFRLDGDIMPFRRYCRQFYPAPQPTAAAPRSKHSTRGEAIANRAGRTDVGHFRRGTPLLRETGARAR